MRVVTVAGLAFSSHAYLQLVESFGLTGHWSWNFDTGIQTWSLGLHRILGLAPGALRPDYDAFRNRVHPEDLAVIETASEIVEDGLLRDHRVRVIRPDGSVRILSTRGEVYVSPEARPRAAACTVLDITEPAHLARAQALERRRRWALFEQSQGFQFTNSIEGEFHFPPELFALTGLPPDAVADDPFLTIHPGEREHWRGLSIEAQAAGLVHIATPLVPLAHGGNRRFVVVTVPVLDAAGSIVEWSSITQPAETAGLPITDGARAGLEQAVRGHHLRAARALLGWSMSDLARASGLSFSTVRRLEDDGESPAARSRHAVIAAMRIAGIRSLLLNGNRIAVARR
ncbi:PAS domain-containing protein [Methylobacterium planeticum]|uniref:histidine kinase n=1 Tax=Methylobacterium planeticum TaxID=2615211 RepID=A0A6N6MY47_9HYPH|nr:PAS domain-containing protein [Methylobacterium planeticum]KAB1075053.1 PAS domain-containing protein [Methylobacterium planeticum]